MLYSTTQKVCTKLVFSVTDVTATQAITSISGTTISMNYRPSFLTSPLLSALSSSLACCASHPPLSSQSYICSVVTSHMQRGWATR